MSLWSCTICSKSFARKGDLTRHESLHTGIKPHVCETCGKGFAQFSALKTHRNIHTKAKPFVCGINTCKKAFADPSSCTRHRKETHMLGGGPLKCFVTGCGTSIKRRSAYVSHLRKHGIDTSSDDVKAIIAAQMSDRGITAPIHSAPPVVENGSCDEVDSRGGSSLLGDSSGCDTTENSGEMSHFMENNGPLDDGPFDCRRANWFTANDASLLDSNFNQTDQVGPSGLAHDNYSYLSSNFEIPSCFDDIFLPKADRSLVSTSPLNVPVLEPFLEAGSDGFQSSSSSPALTYSVLYPTDFNVGMVSLSPVNSVSQDSLPYNSL